MQILYLCMNTLELIDILKKFKANFADKYGIETLGLFGSYARRQQREASDIDVFVKLKKADFFVMMAIQEELEKLTKLKVDIVDFRDSLRESFKENILKDAIYF